MSLSIEWRRRIDCWRYELERHFYKECEVIEFSGFRTKELLSAQEVHKLHFTPMPEGTKWGYKWEYCWFKGAFKIPENLAGKRIVLKIDTGAESCVYINKKAAGAIDKFHFEIPICKSASTYDKFEVLVESYAGHGDRNCHVGPNPEERVVWPDPKDTQTVVGRSSYGVWNEDIYQLWLDIETLYEARENMDSKSLRVMEIDRILKEFTVQIDFQVDESQLISDVKKFREYIKPTMNCRNGSTAPVLYTFGHSHLDVAWKWPIAETIRKCSRTLSNQLSLLEEYPEYIYYQSQPYLLKLTKENYPDIYSEIRKRISEGRIIPDGGMWVEADTNIPNGESLIRQFLYGKKYIDEEFGLDSKVCWLPDVFGYSGALPQIIKGCGVDYFATSKILWAYNGGDVFSYNTFMWEGIDGTKILSHNHNEYNAHTRPQYLAEAWNNRVQEDNIKSVLFPFGYGDGGGGATRNHMEFLNRMNDFEGMPKTKIATPLEFFRNIEDNGLPEERYVGELYFQAHRGTYTSQAKTKKGNRKSEVKLRELEMWSTLAYAISKEIYPYDEIEVLWKKLLVNQFHDIVTGSSIKRVYEEAEKDYEDIINKCVILTDIAKKSIIKKLAKGRYKDNSTSLIIFNSLNWDRNELIEIPKELCTGEIVQKLCLQHEGENIFAEINVPGISISSFHDGSNSVNLKGSKAIELNKEKPSVIATPRHLENDLILYKFNEYGEIEQIIDKQSGRQINRGKCNRFKLYRDEPSMFDAWDIDSMYEMTPIQLNEKAVISVVSSGQLFGKIRIERNIGKSRLIQYVILRRNSKRIDFHTTIVWAETHKLLKVGFEMDIHTNEALHEIQFGHIARPNHFSRKFDADRYEVINHKWTAIVEGNRGAAILNDCKYGINVKGNEMNLTLLKSSIAPDPSADVGVQEFKYSLYVWNDNFEESNLIREAYSFNYPLELIKGDDILQDEFQKICDKNISVLDQQASFEMKFLEISEPNIVVETLKLSEDRKKDIIIRLYESMKMHSICKLKLPFEVEDVWETDMIEKSSSDSLLEGCSDKSTLNLNFRPFEVKTLRVKLKQ